MSRDIQIRTAVPADVAAITAIYNDEVVHGTATWQVELDTVAERTKWLVNHGDRYPVTVAEIDGVVVGWGAISPFRPREGWLPTVENSVYVSADHRRLGIGKALLADLIVRSRALGFHSIVAGISADQPASIALHEQAGFVTVGLIRDGGIKCDRRLDCLFMQLML